MIQPIHHAGPSVRQSAPTAVPSIVRHVVVARLRAGTLRPAQAIAQLLRGGASRDVATAIVYAS